MVIIQESCEYLVYETEHNQSVYIPLQDKLYF